MSMAEFDKLFKQVGFKIKCSNLFLSQKLYNFSFSGIIIKVSK